MSFGPQFTVDTASAQIWPTDKWSRDLILKVLGNAQIGFDYIPTTMGEPALRFRSNEDYVRATTLIRSLTNRMA